MICWSCERATGTADATCAACGALLPPDSATDYFSVLGLPARHDLDLEAAEARFRELSRRFHPDRFAKADPRARRVSLQRSVQLNEAWRTIKDPVRRAEYLLRRAGYDVGAEEGASAPAAADGKRERIAAPPALLGEVLELREELAEARDAGDEARVRAMASEVRARADAALARVAATLATEAQPPPFQLTVAVQDLMALRYFRRFLDEVTAHDEAAAEREQGAAHA